MKRLFRSNKKTNFILISLLTIVFAQAIVIANLYSSKDNKNYNVNLVKINTVKDSIDHRELKQDLINIDHIVRNINSFLLNKNITDNRIASLAKDSLSSGVYVSEQSNRYSQYLVDLEKKLKQVPLGIPTSGHISSNFGKRINPIPFKTINASIIPIKKDSANTTHTEPMEKTQIQFHKGIDFGVAAGTNVFSAAEGKVLFAGPKGGYGNCVIISHANGLATLYAHLSTIEVKTNQQVKVGEIIAKSGNTGRSTGPHLHYEVHKNNVPVNPKLFLNL